MGALNPIQTTTAPWKLKKVHHRLPSARNPQGRSHAANAGVLFPRPQGSSLAPLALSGHLLSTALPPPTLTPLSSFTPLSSLVPTPTYRTPFHFPSITTLVSFIRLPCPTPISLCLPPSVSSLSFSNLLLSLTPPTTLALPLPLPLHIRLPSPFPFARPSSFQARCPTASPRPPPPLPTSTSTALAPALVSPARSHSHVSTSGLHACFPSPH